MRRDILTILFFILLFLSAGTLNAQQADTLRLDEIRQVTVKASKVRSYLKDAEPGSHEVSMRMMQDMPRILGNADPLHYAQMLPGVQTVSEFDAGLHILGSDNSHNQIGINGVPLYNVSHVLGFFSIFNASHYSAMKLTKSPAEADAPNRLGGVVNMLHSEQIDTVLSGEVSVGPMSSQGTLRLPIGKKSQLTASARAAYLNLLYSPLLKADDESYRYDFNDFNLTYLYRLNSRNKFFLDAYHGGDNLGYTDLKYNLGAKFKWSNTMGALHWIHDAEKFSMHHTAYVTNYDTKFKMLLLNINAHLPLGVMDVGYKGKMQWKKLTVGADFVAHNITPQQPEIDGMITYVSDSTGRQKSYEASVYGSWRQSLGSKGSLETALRANLYNVEKQTCFSVDPGVTFKWRLLPQTILSVSGGIKHQYMYKTGFSDIGLPTEFWLSTNAKHPPQYAYHGMASAETYFCDRTYRLSADLYYKRLYHQVEYTGNVLDFLYSEYNLESMLTNGDGYNYGASLMLEKRKGKVTGWMSYSLGRAIRRFPNSPYTGTYPARHERIHELNVVAVYKPTKRWSVGATFVAASGTPYTQAKYLYMINNHIITEYGEYNGKRLAPYIRLDLSANYEFRMVGNRRSGINLSLYNASVRKNQLFCRVKVSKDGEFGYRPYSFLLHIMPSVNYYFIF